MLKFLFFQFKLRKCVKVKRAKNSVFLTQTTCFPIGLEGYHPPLPFKNNILAKKLADIRGAKKYWTASLIQEGLAIKAERMKKKLTGGKKKVEIDEIKVKNFVLFSTVGRYEDGDTQNTKDTHKSLAPKHQLFR